MLCFNSRPSCDGRQLRRNGCELEIVSIHARHATGDALVNARKRRLDRFNSRPSCDGRLLNGGQTLKLYGFNSRPSCDGRRQPSGGVRDADGFNSRPSCDGRHVIRRSGIQTTSFNSRPSCDGRPFPSPWSTGRRLFQFTPVMRRATACPGGMEVTTDVSIHARHATGDRRDMAHIMFDDVSIHARHATGDLCRP